jgi:hypothetical protein
MASFQMKPDVASSFFKDLLLQKDDKALSNKAQREHKTIIDLFASGPGQDLSSAKGTLLRVRFRISGDSFKGCIGVGA